MNKIIKQKRYNTETAQKMGSISYGNGGDFNHYEETLYRKLNGEFFLYGCGGAASKYREEIGQNQWSGGEEIIPLTYPQAQDWAEKNLSGDEYEKIFEVPEEKKITKGFSLSGEAVEALKKISSYRKMNMSDVVEELILKEGKKL